MRLAGSHLPHSVISRRARKIAYYPIILGSLYVRKIEEAEQCRFGLSVEGYLNSSTAINSCDELTLKWLFAFLWDIDGLSIDKFIGHSPRRDGITLRAVGMD